MSVEQCIPEHVKRMSSYVRGKTITELALDLGIARSDIIKLSSNENPLGVSPRARAAMCDVLDEAFRYPDGNGTALKHALALKTGLMPDQFVLGNGSNELLDILARTFLAHDGSGVCSECAYAIYALAIQAVGARCIEVPMRFYSHDLAAMADAVADDTRIIYIANPNNPTGTFVPGGLIESFLSRVSRDIVVVLDEAYTDYLQPELRYDSFSWIRQFPNLVVVRTFSKIYGLGGVRVGYAAADPAVVELVNRMREPFNVSSLGLAAAEAALGDKDFLERSYQVNREGMAQLRIAFERMNLEYIPSAGNFMAVRVGDAAKVHQALLQQGVIVRTLVNYGMPNWLRVTVGLEAENARFLAALEVVLKG